MNIRTSVRLLTAQSIVVILLLVAAASAPGAAAGLPGATEYGYDDNGRLVDAAYGKGRITYGYDAAGNMTGLVVTGSGEVTGVPVDWLLRSPLVPGLETWLSAPCGNHGPE